MLAFLYMLLLIESACVDVTVEGDVVEGEGDNDEEATPPAPLLEGAGFRAMAEVDAWPVGRVIRKVVPKPGTVATSGEGLREEGSGFRATGEVGPWPDVCVTRYEVPKPGTVATGASSEETSLGTTYGLIMPPPPGAGALEEEVAGADVEEQEAV